MTCAFRAKDGLFGLFMLVLSAALIAQSHSYHDESSQFPRFLAYTLAGLSLAYFGNLWRQARKAAASQQDACTATPFWPPSAWTRQSVPVFMLLAAYLYAISLLGYYSATALFLMGSMLGYSRAEALRTPQAGTPGLLPKRRLLNMSLAAGGFLILTWLLFTRFLGTRMPEGVLF